MRPQSIMPVAKAQVPTLARSNSINMMTPVGLTFVSHQLSQSRVGESGVRLGGQEWGVPYAEMKEAAN